MELRFTVSDLKIKETQYLEQIDEIKSLLRKYYLKAKQNELRVNTQGSPETSFCGQPENIVLTVPDFPRRKCPLPRNDKRDGVVSAHLFANSEKEISAILPSHPHKTKLGNLNTSFDAKDNNKNFLEVKDSFGII